MRKEEGILHVVNREMLQGEMVNYINYALQLC